MVEVHVTIEKESPKRPTWLEGQQCAKHDRAVTAQYDWEGATIEDGADCASELAGVIRDRLLVQEPVVRIALPIKRRWFDTSTKLGANPFSESSLQKSVPTLLDAVRGDAEGRRRLNDDGQSHFKFLSILWRAFGKMPADDRCNFCQAQP